MHLHDELTAEFESQRRHLWAVSYRMLGGASDADDAVQEAWLRYEQADTSGIENLGGWLTTVTGRICLDMLRRRTSRRETVLEDQVSPGIATMPTTADPEREAMLSDEVERAMLVVLETLSPPERLAFVLHDMFSMPFDDIAPIVGKSTLATRQMASRARRRIQAAHGNDLVVPANRADNEEVVRAFVRASRGGDFASLLVLLDPEVVVRADAVAVALGTEAVRVGQREVAEFFNGRARAARVVTINGQPGAAWFVGRDVKVAFVFTVEQGTVMAIDLIGDPAELESFDIVPAGWT